MKILYDDVVKQIEQAQIGSTVEVLVANATRRNNSSPYYHRKGILIDKDKDKIMVDINGRKYKMSVSHGTKWIGEYPNQTRVETEYAYGLYSVREV